MSKHVLTADMFHKHSSYLHHHHPATSVFPGVVSQQDNGKTFSVSSTIRIPVERKDNGAALSCEAYHPALGGQRKVRHYRLDVYCKSDYLVLYSNIVTYYHVSGITSYI